MLKRERHKVILNIINRREVGTQEELVRELILAGIKVNQGTVSRDIRALGLQKVRNRAGKGIYATSQTAPIEESVKQLRKMVISFVQNVNRTNNLIVIKTSPGTAQGVAAVIDKVGFAGLLGTVAGDDTILLIAKDEKNGKALEERLGGTR